METSNEEPKPTIVALGNDQIVAILVDFENDSDSQGDYSIEEDNEPQKKEQTTLKFSQNDEPSVNVCSNKVSNCCCLGNGGDNSQISENLMPSNANTNAIILETIYEAEDEKTYDWDDTEDAGILSGDDLVLDTPKTSPRRPTKDEIKSFFGHSGSLETSRTSEETSGFCSMTNSTPEMIHNDSTSLKSVISNEDILVYPLNNIRTHRTIPDDICDDSEIAKLSSTQQQSMNHLQKIEYDSQSENETASEAKINLNNPADQQIKADLLNCDLTAQLSGNGEMNIISKDGLNQTQNDTKSTNCIEANLKTEIIQAFVDLIIRNSSLDNSSDETSQTEGREMILLPTVQQAVMYTEKENPTKVRMRPGSEIQIDDDLHIESQQLPRSLTFQESIIQIPQKFSNQESGFHTNELSNSVISYQPDSGLLEYPLSQERPRTVHIVAPSPQESESTSASSQPSVLFSSLKRSPGVLGVNELLQKTDDELTNLMVGQIIADASPSPLVSENSKISLKNEFVAIDTRENIKRHKFLDPSRKATRSETKFLPSEGEMYISDDDGSFLNYGTDEEDDTEYQIESSEILDIQNDAISLTSEKLHQNPDLFQDLIRKANEVNFWRNETAILSSEYTQSIGTNPRTYSTDTNTSTHLFDPIMGNSLEELPFIDCDFNTDEYSLLPMANSIYDYSNILEKRHRADMDEVTLSMNDLTSIASDWSDRERFSGQSSKLGNLCGLRNTFKKTSGDYRHNNNNSSKERAVKITDSSNQKNNRRIISKNWLRMFNCVRAL